MTHTSGHSWWDEAPVAARPTSAAPAAADAMVSRWIATLMPTAPATHPRNGRSSAATGRRLRTSRRTEPTGRFTFTEVCAATLTRTSAAVVSDQFLVCALFHDVSAIEHHDPVGLTDRGQSMRDHQRGAAPP